MRLFKSDLQLPVETIINEIVPKLIEAAVLKGQIEILAMLVEGEHSTRLHKYKNLHRSLIQQLNHVATTEDPHGEDDDIPEDDYPKKLYASLRYASPQWLAEMKEKGYEVVDTSEMVLHDPKGLLNKGADDENR